MDNLGEGRRVGRRGESNDEAKYNKSTFIKYRNKPIILYY